MNTLNRGIHTFHIATDGYIEELLNTQKYSVPARSLHGGTTPCPYLTAPCTFYALCIYGEPGVIGNYDTVRSCIS